MRCTKAGFSRSALGREFGARLLWAVNDQTMRDSGDVCGARNMQFEQEFFGLFLGETVSAYDWRDRIGDFCESELVPNLHNQHLSLFVRQALHRCSERKLRFIHQFKLRLDHLFQF